MVEYYNIMVENMCRVCLESEEENSFKNMQIPYMENEEAIAIMFSGIGKVKYAPNDGLPQKICDQCLNELIVCYEFQKKCIKSDTEIRKILENHFDSIELKNDGESETEIKAEISSVHSDDENYENTPFNEIVEFQIERTTNYKCEICYKIFDRKFNYNRHIKSHKPGEANNESRANHIKSHNQKTTTSNSKSEYHNNRDVETIMSPLELKNCTNIEYIEFPFFDVSFNEEIVDPNLTNNDRIDEEELTDLKKIKNAIHECELCNKIFDRKSRLQKHMRKHNSGKLHNSEVTENINDDSIDEIEISNPGNKRSAIFKCEVCCKSFNRKYHLQRHMKTHNPEGRPFECEICKKRFASQINVKRHQINHRKESLVSHIRKHKSNTTQLERRKGCESEIEMEMDRILSDNENICENSLERRNKAEKSPIESKSQNHNNAEVKTNIKTLEFKDCTDTEYVKYTSRDAVAKEENISNKKLMGIKENIIVKDMIDEVELSDPKNKSKAIHKCAICNKIFDRKYSLRRHLSVHDIEGWPFECNICKWRFASQKHLTNHEAKHYIDDYFTENNQMVSQCSYCPRKFSKRESLASHIMRVHKSHIPKDKESDKIEKHFKCQFCSKSFNQIISLARHLYIHDDEKDFKCNFCDKNFSQAKHLVEHIQWHKSAHLFQCKICKKSFNQPYNLKDHMRTHSGEKPYLCSECGRAFYDSSTLRQHIKRHSGEKPFECSECPSKFAFSGDLKYHMHTHTKLQPYACNLCGSKFTKRASLNIHNLIHTGEKPYECQTCHMKFTRTSHVKRHNLIHTGEKPHCCEYCGKAYVQSNDLVKHLKTHLGDKIYKCSKCNESFRLKKELRDHLSEHYRKEKQVNERVEDINKDTKEEV